MNLATILSAIFLNIQQFHAKSDCIKLDITITQKIENLGFHRDIHWLIETPKLDAPAWQSAPCSAALKIPIGTGMFVNPDQADDLRRLGKLDIMIDGDVDVEAPAHLATRHTVYIFLNSSELVNQISIMLPIHLRYQMSMMGGYGKVVLSTPIFLVHCPQSNSIICGRDKPESAPSSSDDFETLKVWKNIPYKANFDEMELFVPIGNLDHFTWVIVISIVIGAAGGVYLISLMTPPDDDEKNNKK